MAVILSKIAAINPKENMKIPNFMKNPFSRSPENHIGIIKEMSEGRQGHYNIIWGISWGMIIWSEEKSKMRISNPSVSCREMRRAINVWTQITINVESLDGLTNRALNIFQKVCKCLCFWFMFYVLTKCLLREMLICSGPASCGGECRW